MPIWWSPGKPVVMDDEVVMCEVASSTVVVDAAGHSTGTSSSTDLPVPQDFEAATENAGHEAVGAEDAVAEETA
eukprot:1225932-Amphidinium_carterae.1